jgi:hypothetical protein
MQVVNNHIHVETRKLTDDEYWGRRSIVLTLRVQSKQDN